MTHKNFIITETFKEVAGTTIFRVLPERKEDLFSFIAGQHCRILNPKYSLTDDRCFSIASSPTNKKYYEFSIKTYGNWTQAIAQLKKGDTLKIAGPYGNFTWDESVKNAVFIVGGLGIAPLMSMLRYAASIKSSTKITLFYCNKSEETIVFKKELEVLEKELLGLKVIHIFSQIPKHHPWNGYRGFITEDIVKYEVDVLADPTFFVIGPQTFMGYAKDLLANLNLQKVDIREELLTQAAPQNYTFSSNVI